MNICSGWFFTHVGAIVRVRQLCHRNIRRFERWKAWYS